MANDNRKVEVPLKGRLITANDPATLGASDFQSLKNMRYRDTSPVGVKGYRKTNSATAIATYAKLQSGINYRKSAPSAETHCLVQAVDSDGNGKIFDNVTAIGSQGDFSGTALYTESAGAGKGVFALGPAGLVAYANGKDTLLWGGAEIPVSAYLDTDGTYRYDYTEAMGNSLTDSDNLAIVHSTASAATLYIGSPLPLSGIKFYVQVANSTTAALTGIYDWSGTAWASVGTVTDGTSVGGKTLAQTGTMTFASRVGTSQLRSIDGVVLYWYKVLLEDVSATTALSRVTLVAPMQGAVDLWDGAFSPVVSFILESGTNVYHDMTVNVTGTSWQSSITESWASIGNIGITMALYAGFAERQQGIKWNIAGDKANLGNVSQTVSYWNGSDWTALTIDDNTKIGSTTIAMSGLVTWTPPSPDLEHKKKLSSSAAYNPSLYYYRIQFSAETNAGTGVFNLGGVPAQRPLNGFSVPVHHLDRLWLLGNPDCQPNLALYSAYDSAQVFNGDDSGEIPIGDRTAIVGGVSLYSRYGGTTSALLVIFKESSTWIIYGDSPDTYKVYPLTEVDGCTAPATPTVISVTAAEGVHRRMAVWQSQNGIVATDGSGITLISGDIADRFDPNHANYVGAALSTAWGCFDPTRNEYIWCVPGVCRYHYDVLRKKWFEHTATSFACAFAAAETNGTGHVYLGGLSDGRMYQGEYGITFDGATITNELWTADLAVNGGRVSDTTLLEGVRLVARSKTDAATIGVTTYTDGVAPGIALDAISQINASGRIFATRRMRQSKGGNFHSVKMVVSNPTEAPGFEPLYLTMHFKSTDTL